MRRLGVAVATAVALAVVVAAMVAAPAGAGDEPGLAAPRALRVVNLNLLHGVFCPADTEGCQAPDRVELLVRQLEEADCPEIVGLQEINAALATLLTREVPKICDGAYEQAFTKKPRTLDTEQVLTTLDIRSSRVVTLAGRFRTASRVVMDSPLGPVVLVVTHQDGDAEGGAPGPPCRLCPPPCQDVDASALQCQTIIAARLADRAGGDDAIRILMGDFNVTSTSRRYLSLIEQNWEDTHLAAGNAECDPLTSAGCTAGRDDKTLPSLTDPSKRQVERIDFIFVKPPEGCDLELGSPAQALADADANGVATGIWNGEPTLDGPGGIVWTSDHTGTSADVSCAGSG